MQNKVIKKQFRARAATFDSSAKWVKDKKLLEMHCRAAAPLSESLILEVCCGTGAVGRALTHRHPGSRVVGADISLDMLKHARRRLWRCINAKIEALPFADNTFSAVVCRQAFHFLDAPQAVSEMLRVARPGARIVLSQIVPFNLKDKGWLKRIHAKKQPLLKNFLMQDDIQQLLEGARCKNIAYSEYLLEEPVSHWLKDTFFPEKEIREIKKLFLNAPEDYKRLHNTRQNGTEIYDTMRWVIFKGDKINEREKI